jgi:flavorubredoxin
MNTDVDQIADNLYRLSTLMPDIGPTGFTFNQFLLDAEEPLLYHTGMRGIFPLVSRAIEQVMPLAKLRWISFSHVEADECGAVNELLAASPQAQVVHGELGCMLSLNDLCDRPPLGLADGEVLALGAAGQKHRVLGIPTPHVPHNWESHVLFEQHTGTLFCGDLLTQLGDGPAVTDADVIEAAITAEEVFGQTSRGPAIPATYRRLANLEPQTLAIMHGSSYNGDCAALLRTMAEVYEERFGCDAPQAHPVPAHAVPVG